ncbi:hypothetical protein LR48_Vigan05g103900 [Vigna angularis]|uniref:Uncharacterized protein n=1 Tax=Phaseolus angularis TaxID=3914 RepID=A0A0L9UKM3_PHAAN|nr:hypothetical protein LR48_Vigan05g103900 [Vigna angularis]
MQKKCDRVALSGNLALSGSFQVSKSPLRGKTAAGGQNGSCASTAQRKQKQTFHPLGVDWEMMTALLFSF